MEELNDATFLDRLKARDESAFESLIKKLGRHLLSFVKKMGVSEDQAEEIVSDTFLKVHKSVIAFEPREAKFTTWVIQIAKNRTLDYLRKKRLEEESLTEKATNAAAIQRYNVQFEYEGLESERTIRARRALMSLSKSDREILLMKQEMSYGEIAASVNEEEGTLRTRYSRAKKKFKAAFEAGASND